MPRSDPAERATERILLGASVGLTAVVAWWWLRNDSFLDQRVGLAEIHLVSAWAWLLAVGVAVTYSTYTLIAIPSVRSNAMRWSRLKIVGIWVAVGSGIVEEIVFRHLLMNALDARGFTVAAQIAASALIFGMAHAAWTLLARDWRITLPVIASTAALGALLALVYLASERSTMPAIAAHIGINLVIEPWLVLAAINGSWSRPTTDPSPSQE